MEQIDTIEALIGETYLLLPINILMEEPSVVDGLPKIGELSFVEGEETFLYAQVFKLEDKAQALTILEALYEEECFNTLTCVGPSKLQSLINTQMRSNMHYTAC